MHFAWSTKSWEYAFSTFTSGFVSNEAAISTIARLLPDCLILSDQLNHASMIAGVKSSGVAKQLFAAMGIARDDKDARQDWVMRGFRQFDAPVCVIITYDRDLDGSDDTPFDCGGVANALVNAAWSRGLGTVINSQGIMQSPVVREHAGIADDQVIMKSIALGWPDETFPANAVVSERKSVKEATTFVGFDE